MISRFMERRVHCFACFLLLIPAVVGAATYYVDSAAGNDGNNGQNINSAWQTISKVNSQTFNPGDSILFKCGDIWREQLNISSSGAAGNPITFGSYGTGAQPVISGANVIPASAWAPYSGNIYVANIGTITPPTQLYVDGAYYDPAHYPQSGYLTATANSTNTTSIIDSNLNLTTSQVVGSTVQVRAVSWSITTLTATAYNTVANEITLNGPVYNSTLAMGSGWGFYLQNMLWMLSYPGAWYYDPVAGNLYLWTTGSDSPSGHTVELSSRAYGIYVNTQNYVLIQNLEVVNANQDDVHMQGANNVIVNGLAVSGGQNGIYFYASNSTVQNCSISNTLSNGIWNGWTEVSNVSILNNAVNTAGNVGACPLLSLAAIYVVGTFGSGATINITGNSVANSGYIGIRGDGGVVNIQNNIVDSSCLRLDDCGGIYTYGVNPGTTSKIITGNTVTNSIGNFSGTPKTSTQTRGIYLDDGSYNVTVQNNMISNADYGIHIHDGNNNTITANSFYSSRISGLYISEDTSSFGYVNGNTITNNTFATVSTGATAFYYSSIEATTTNFGTYNSNLYCHPNSTYVVTNQSTNYTLPAWQQATGQDLNSTDTTSACTPPIAPTGLRLLNN